MAIQGVRHSDNFVAEQRPKNWREGILLMWPNGKAPLTGLTSGMRSQDTDDPEYNWWEKQLQKQRFDLDGAHTDAVGNLTVVEGAQKLVEGHLLRIEHTGEIVRVNSDPTVGTTIPVTRGYAGTPAAAVDAGTAEDNPKILVIGTAFAENADTPTGLNFDPKKVYNFTQIFRNSLEASRTAMNTRLRTGDQVREAKRECLEYHSIEMERAWFWGSRWEGTEGGLPIRTTGGINYFMENYAPENVVNQNGAATDMETVEDWMERIFRFGSSEKMAFLGNKGLLTIQRIIRKNSDYELSQGQKEYGMDVNKLVSPFGSVVLKSHPLFNYAEGGVNGTTPYFGWNSSMFVLDMENIKYRYLKGGDTQYLADRQGNGIDGKKSEYLTEAGLEIHHPATHFVVKGLTEAAVDS